MKQEIEREFVELSESMIESADQIPCQMKDYVEGLEIMISALESRLESAKHELRENN